MKAFRVRSILLAAAFLARIPTAADADGFLLTMDDLPLQQVHNLVHPTGVEFAFTVGSLPSTDATYAFNSGPGSITFVQDPSIEGTAAGLLSVTLPEPAFIVRFGVARSLLGPSSATVELINPADESLGTQSIPLTPMPLFAEGQFVYQGQPVSRFNLTFPALGGGRFAFDNLFFETVPEPVSVTLAAMAAAFSLTVSRGLRG